MNAVDTNVLVYFVDADEPTPPVLAASLDLSFRHSLSHWDSLLLAACIDAGITTLYSEDLSDGVTYDSVTVVNPFV